MKRRDETISREQTPGVRPPLSVGRQTPADWLPAQAQQWLAAVVASSDDAIISKTLDGTIKSWNEGATRVFGYLPEEIIGQSILKLIPPELQDQERLIVAQLKRGSRIDHFETIRLRKDGSRIEVSLSVSPIRDGSGAVVGAAKIARDITETKRLQEAQRELTQQLQDQAAELEQQAAELEQQIEEGQTLSEELEQANADLREAVEKAEAARDEAAMSRNRLQFLAEASNILASSLDYETTLRHVAELAVPRLSDWCVVHILESADTLRQVAVAHVDPAKIEGAEELWERYPPNPHATSGVANVVRTGRTEFYPTITDELLVASAVDPEHLRLIRALGLSAGLIVPISVRGRTLGAISLVMAESHRTYQSADITLAEQLAGRAAVAVTNARLFKEAEDARSTAVAASAAKTQFLRTMSHEVRTPLNAILGYSELLELGLSGPLSSEQREHVHRLRESAGHLLQMVNEILDLSKVEAGSLEVQLVPTAVAGVLDASVASVLPQAAKKGISVFRQGCLEAPHAKFIGDELRARQVLLNLLANAVKFTEPGGRIEVACSLSNAPPATVSPSSSRYVMIRITDNGIGIAQDQLERIFESFTQVNSAYTRTHPGTGLGLAISRRLARAMSGEVTAESRPGEGSTFSLWLPADGPRQDFGCLPG